MSQPAAYHQAGHAVIDYLAGFPLGPVGIIEERGFATLRRPSGAFSPQATLGVTSGGSTP
jgi:hypothetical protein